MAAKPLPSVEYLRECFAHNMEDGTLTWRVRPLEHFINQKACTIFNAKFPNKLAGYYAATGRLIIWLNGANHFAHRIMWKMEMGIDPPALIDHKNNEPRHNKLDNLRLATSAQNAQNSRLRSDNTSGHKGVWWNANANKWSAMINFNGSRRFLGNHKNIADAHAAYAKAATLLHGEFAKIL